MIGIGILLALIAAMLIMIYGVLSTFVHMWFDFTVAERQFLKMIGESNESEQSVEEGD